MVNACRQQSPASAKKAVDRSVGFLWKCAFPVEPLLKTSEPKIHYQSRFDAIRQSLAGPQRAYGY